MGRVSLAAAALPLLSQCSTGPKKAKGPVGLPFKPVPVTSSDQLVLAEGFTYDILIKWQDPINSKGDKFGFNNDFIAFVPLTEGASDEGLLWVNHESVEPYYTTGWEPGQKRTAKDVNLEMKEVGGSILHIKKINGRWDVVQSSKYNRRISGHTRIPMIAPRPIENSRVAVGTLANCAGGVTPWRTILTCEENYHNFYGEHIYDEKGNRKWVPGPYDCGWHKVFRRPPEHYGWVVEIDPFTGRSKKLTALGRFSHECATTIRAKDGRVIVYSGDDQSDECLYKFISKKNDSLEDGELFVANIERGQWLSLDINKHPELKRRFKDQTEVLVRARDAARIVGASLLDRPEDVEIDPVTGAIFVTLTNNKKRNNYHGSILKIEETNGDYASLTFKASTFLAGGADTGFSSPDNLAFDAQGNLWMCNDVSGSKLDKGPYEGLGNNGLYYIPFSGPDAGQAFRVASAPRGAEFTGPYFSPDGETLFLSVQHPGESDDIKKPSSHWPKGGDALPEPAVIMISGPMLNKLTQGTPQVL